MALEAVARRSPGRLGEASALAARGVLALPMVWRQRALALPRREGRLALVLLRWTYRLPRRLVALDLPPLLKGLLALPLLRWQNRSALLQELRAGMVLRAVELSVHSGHIHSTPHCSLRRQSLEKAAVARMAPVPCSQGKASGTAQAAAAALEDCAAHRRQPGR